MVTCVAEVMTSKATGGLKVLISAVCLADKLEHPMFLKYAVTVMPVILIATLKNNNPMEFTKRIHTEISFQTFKMSCS
jgi:hypothetical protein